MTNFNYSNLEKKLFNSSGHKSSTTRIPYLLAENFPKLGFYTALRFLEWISVNPEGVISLPTGKTPEYFIKWTSYILNNFNSKNVRNIFDKYELKFSKKPETKGLHFFQMDEFYPIDSSQHNSFCNYVKKFYISEFDLDPARCYLIDSNKIPLPDGKHFKEVFPDLTIDLSLRNREARNSEEKLMQSAIYMVDNWCREYEQTIRDLGGIGFFLGGIGPDGHIAFNVKGSDLFSTTRLTATNYETQAAAASDLGGIEVSRNRLVITIGLGTITWNPDAVAIIFAAGEAKAKVVADALENDANVIYPGTALQKLNNAKFFLTYGAASKLQDLKNEYYDSGEWTFEKTYRAVSDLCKKIDKYAKNITMEDLLADDHCKKIPGLSLETIVKVQEETINRINKGMQREENEVYLHTGPHHDDIMLGIFPHVIQQLRQPSNTFHFSILTSGFTSVTNHLLKDILINTKKLLSKGEIQMTNYPDFFEKGYKYKYDKDVNHYLNEVANNNEYGKKRGLSHRLVRNLVDIYKLKSKEELRKKIEQLIVVMDTFYDGEKNPTDIQRLKGIIREYEEELVWAHFGVRVKDIEHNRLGFYTGDIFTEQPDKMRDVIPVLEMFRRLKPTIISLAFDPEGSGPDTHYKVLQTMAEALRIYSNETDVSKLKIRGYRNVWYRFHPSEANFFVPVSLNTLAVLDKAFKNCYISQVNASFPSPDLDGPFSQAVQKIWVEQMKDIQLLLGKDFFYEHTHPRIRGTHGFVFMKEMSVNEFLTSARRLEKSMEGSISDY